MDISVIIVNYNTWHYLKPCIESIKKNFIKVSYEIIVVDNASIDGSQQKIKKEFPDVILIENKENLGFAVANNKAIKMASGKYLFLLNADTIILNDKIKDLFDYMDNNNNEIAIAGPQQLNEEGMIIKSFSSSKDFNTHKKKMLLDALYINKFLREAEINFAKIQKVGYLNGAALIIKKAVIKQIGLFDERFFFMAEEVDLGFRCHNHGYDIAYFPEFKILHYGSSGNGLFLWGLMQYHYSNFKLFEKYGSSKGIARLIFLLWLFTRTIYSIASIIIFRETKLNIRRLIIYLRAIIWHLSLNTINFGINYK